MNRIKLILLLIMSTALITACERKEEPAAELTPEESWQATRAMTEWFECEECEENELKAVVNFGKSVVPLLSSTLQQGAAPASRELLRIELEKRYDELKEYQKTHPEVKTASATKEEFVNLYLSNYDAQHRTRAAQALGAIGGEKAKTALKAAMKDLKREDERTAAETALKELTTK